MVLVNGADGIGTGWMTKIPNYNPREIVANLQRMLKGKEPTDMKLWYKNFQGTIEQLDHQTYRTRRRRLLITIIRIRRRLVKEKNY